MTLVDKVNDKIDAYEASARAERPFADTGTIKGHDLFAASVAFQCVPASIRDELEQALTTQMIVARNAKAPHTVANVAAVLDALERCK